MNYDVTILGGGLAGLSLALQLRDQLPQATIAVLEKRKHPVPEAAHKVGESTVEVAAYYFANVLGFKQHILDEQLPKLGLRFFFPQGDNREIENRLELGGRIFAPASSYQLDRGRFENFLANQCLERGIEFCHETRIQSLKMGKGRDGHRVTVKQGSETREIQSRWLVDASGRRAFVKRELGLAKNSEHLANAAWFRFKNRIKIDDWSNDPLWSTHHSGKTARWYSTNHFMGEGYWVWIIPLSSGSTSMGIVAGEPHHSLSEFNSIDKSIGWLEEHEPQIAEVVKDNLDSLQDFRAIKRYAVECQQVFSSDRWGITGEAGFFHDPFYSPGSDFIAFANTFLTDLIRRDLNGSGIRIRSFAYDRIFKRFYYGTCTAYQDQYRLFGNPEIMPIKILWDYLIYWSITAFIFMQGRMCHQLMYLRNIRRLNRLGKMNHYMQETFRRWHSLMPVRDADELPQGTVDISSMPIIRKMNQQLIDPLPGGEFHQQFTKNVEQLETLFWEILEHAGVDASDAPFAKKHYSSAMPNCFAHVFENSRPMKPMAVS